MSPLNREGNENAKMCYFFRLFLKLIFISFQFKGLPVAIIEFRLEMLLIICKLCLATRIEVITFNIDLQINRLYKNESIKPNLT